MKEIFRRIDENILFNNQKKIYEIKEDEFLHCYILTDQSIKNPKYKVIKNLDNLSKDDIKKSLFFIYFSCDSEAFPNLEKIIENGGKFIPHIHSRKTRYMFTDKKVLNALIKTDEKSHRISHFNLNRDNKHENICEALNITKNVDGDYVEIGVYKGGSALTALNFLEEIEQYNKKMWLFDTYEGFSYEEAQESSDSIWKNTHELFGEENTKKYIEKTFEFNRKIDYNLITLNICRDDLPKDIKKISVANIDVDIMDATYESLLKVSPLISNKGIIICEDASSTPSLYGAYYSMEKFLSTEEGKKYIKIFKEGQYFLLKTL